LCCTPPPRRSLPTATHLEALLDAQAPQLFHQQEDAVAPRSDVGAQLLH
jgi:hypothetical protein